MGWCVDLFEAVRTSRERHEHSSCTVRNLGLTLLARLWPEIAHMTCRSTRLPSPATRELFDQAGSSEFAEVAPTSRRLKHHGSRRKVTAGPRKQAESEAS